MKVPRNEKYRQIALYASVTAILTALIILLIVNFSSVFGVIGDFFKILQPLIYGFIMAYLINPLMRFFETKVFKFKKAKVRRITSMIVSIVLVVAVIALMIYAIIPQITQNFSDFAKSVPTYISNIQEGLDNFVKEHSDSILNKNFSSVSELLKAYGVDFSLSNVTGSLINWVKNASANFTTYATAIISQVVNVVIGIFLTIYFLYSKEKIAAQAKKITAAIFSRRSYLNIVRFTRYTNKTFGGFLSGKIIDSIVIGIIAFIAFAIFKVPYYPMMGAIIGITNFIPTFGPIVGGVIGALLVLLADPSKILVFLIIVLIIQQLDGNIIGPAILGNSTGISSMWIIIGITIFGGLWGFIGLIVGIPLMAIIYMLIKQATEFRLKEKHLPYHTAFYENDPSSDGESDNRIMFLHKDDVIPEITEADDTPDEDEKPKETLTKKIGKLFKKKNKSKSNK